MFGAAGATTLDKKLDLLERIESRLQQSLPLLYACLLYTSDAADERSSVDLGGRRLIKKKQIKKKKKIDGVANRKEHHER